MSYKNKISFRFSAIYFTIFLVIGINAPFWPLWLSSKGLDSRSIAIIMSLSVLIKIFSNPFFAGLGDRYGNRRMPMIYLSLISCIILLFLNSIQSLIFLSILAILLWGAFAPLMPLAESMTTTATKQYSFDYGKIRLWGSVSFILMALSGGILVENYGLIVVPYIMSFGAFCVFVSVLIAPSILSPPSRHNFKILTLLKNRSFLPFLMACGAIQGSHGVYYSFATIHWKSLGISETIIGGLWAEGVLFEIFLLAYFYKIKKYFTAKTMIIVASFTASLRWILTMYFTDPISLALVQTLHSITFGLTHIAAIYYISETMPSRAQAKSQALYSAISMGIFMSLAIAISGDLFELYKEKAFLFSAFLSLLGALIALKIKKAN